MGMCGVPTQIPVVVCAADGSFLKCRFICSGFAFGNPQLGAGLLPESVWPWKLQNPRRDAGSHTETAVPFPETSHRHANGYSVDVSG